MREILISIQPQWVKKILNGEKTIEIRKTKPSCDLPAKVYIYCTNDKKQMLAGTSLVKHSWVCWNRKKWNSQQKKDCGYGKYNGKVVAEFTLNKITKREKNFIDMNDDVCYNFTVTDVHNAGFDIDALSLVDFDAFVENYGNGKPLYAWHIDNLKIYDKPKELSEFRQTRKVKAYNFGIWSLEVMPLTRPPQSYMYVEDWRRMKRIDEIDAMEYGFASINSHLRE